MSVERRKLKGGWRWRFTRMIGGVRLHSRSIYLTRAEAERAEIEAVSNYLRTGQRPQESIGTSISTGKSPSVAALLIEWVAWLHEHRSPRHANDMKTLMARACAQAPELAQMPALALSAQDVERWAARWRADLVARGKGAGEVNKFLRYAQTAFNRRGGSWGRRRGQPDIVPNPFEVVDRYPVERGAKYVPSPEEVAAVRAAAAGDFGLYLDLLIQTGARPSEGLHLTWEDVGPDWVVLRTRKTARGDRLPRRVRIQAGLASDLEARRAEANGGRYVFGQADRDAPHHYIWPRKQHLAACSRAGVRPFPVGCYRHHHAVELYRQTRDLLAVQERLGHADAKTTQHYLRSLLAR